MSRYALFRRRLAPIAFLIAIGLIAHDSCQKHKRTHATVRLELANEATVREVAVDVVVGGEVMAQFRKTALPERAIGPCELELSIPEDDGELRIEVDRGATRQRLTRRFHAIEASTIRVPVPDEPTAPAAR